MHNAVVASVAAIATIKEAMTYNGGDNGGDCGNHSGGHSGSQLRQP
jgi:hypothetical protein